MKRLISILLVALFIASAFTFSSCSLEKIKNMINNAGTDTNTDDDKLPQTSSELLDKINEEMDKVASYQLDLTTDMEFYVAGKKVVGQASTKTIEMFGAEDEYYYYSDSNTNLKCDELKIDDDLYTLRAYQNGVMYMTDDNGNVRQSFYSSMSLEDFRAINDEGSDSEFDMTDCRTTDFVRNEDGTYEINCQGYTKKAINSYVKETGLDSEMLGGEILDFNITILANASYLVTEMRVEYVFEEQDDADKLPRIESVGKYSKFNEAEREEISAYDFDLFDIKLLYDIEKMMKDIQLSEGGTFVIDETQTIKIMGQSSVVKLKYTGEYGSQSDYYYDIKIENDGAYQGSLKYEDGTQTVITSSGTTKDTQTDKEAKETVADLLDIIEFEVINVSEINSNENGKYNIAFAYTDEAPYQQAFAKMGATYTGVSQNATITVENGKIVAIENVIEAKGKIVSGNNTYNIGLTINTKMTSDKLSSKNEDTTEI